MPCSPSSPRAPTPVEARLASTFAQGEESSSFGAGQAFFAPPSEVTAPLDKVGATQILETDKIRVTFTHAKEGVTGLTEFEAWSDDRPPIKPAPSPAGNLALNEKGQARGELSREEVTDQHRRTLAQEHTRYVDHEGVNAKAAHHAQRFQAGATR